MKYDLNMYTIIRVESTGGKENFQLKYEATGICNDSLYIV